MNLIWRKVAFLPLTVCLCLSTAGVGHSSAVLPLNPGSTWTYRDQEGNLETLDVKGTRNVKGVPLIEASYGKQPPFFFIPSEEGLFRLDTAPGSDTFPRGELILLAQRPLEPGRTWQSSWSDPPLFFEVLSRGPVTVPAGTFRDTIKIGFRPAMDPIYSGFIWLHPGVGIIAQERSNDRSELTTYSLSDLLPPPESDMPGSRLASMFQVVQTDKKGAPPTFPASRKVLGWMRQSGVPFGFFILLLVLFVTVIYLIIRSGRREIDLAEDKAVTEGELTLCSAMVRDGLFDEAGEILVRLSEDHPQWPDIAALLGKTYLYTGNLEEARLELKRALTLNPNMPSVRLDLACVYLRMEDPTRALTETDTILAGDNRYADAFFCRGQALEAMGKDDLAAKAYQEALSINPRFRKAQEKLENLQRDPEGKTQPLP